MKERTRVNVGTVLKGGSMGGGAVLIKRVDGRDVHCYTEGQCGHSAIKNCQPGRSAKKRVSEEVHC